jgi:hypothetical protein
MATLSHTLPSLTAGRFDEVISLTEEQLHQPYYITSIIFIGKISQRRGLDNNLYNGYSIAVRSDDEDIQLYDTPSAWLIEEDTGACAVLLKVASMPWLWAFGDKRSTHSTMLDGVEDVASVLESGRVPSRYVLVRFPRGCYLRNVLTPFGGNWSVRRIERSSELAIANEAVDLIDGPIEWDPPEMHNITEKTEWSEADGCTVKERIVVARGVQVKTKLIRSHLQCYFHLARASESAGRRNDVLAPSDGRKELNSLYSQFKRSPGTPPASST